MDMEAFNRIPYQVASFRVVSAPSGASKGDGVTLYKGDNYHDGAWAVWSR